jgi:hypothetical protein
MGECGERAALASGESGEERIPARAIGERQIAFAFAFIISPPSNLSFAGAAFRVAR